MKPKKEEEQEETKPKLKKSQTIKKNWSRDWKERRRNSIIKSKTETEKSKVAKKETENVNPETVPLLESIVYKHMRDKMKKEKMQEDADYLKPKMNPSQLAISKMYVNIKLKDVNCCTKND